jgi:thioredoxin reductase
MLADEGVKTDTTSCIVVDAQMQTSIEGVYAAGDATCNRKYQIAVSLGQAIVAALNIIKKHAEMRKSS